MKAIGPFTLTEKQKFELNYGPMMFNRYKRAIVAYVSPLPQFETSRKKTVCTEKVYEVNQAKTSLWISSISLSLAFIKQANFYVFRRIATLLKKV